MNKISFIKIQLFVKNIMPYMVFLIFVLLLVNFVKLQEIQDDIYTIQQEVENTRSDVSDLYDKCGNDQANNDDVIQAIKAHHKVISDQIDEAERQIKANAIIWGR